MKSFNKERFWWVAFASAITALWVWGQTSQKRVIETKDSVIQMQQRNQDRTDSACATDKHNMAAYYEGVIKDKDSTIFALKDDKYRSVLDILNVKKINGKIKIEQ